MPPPTNQRRIGTILDVLDEHVARTPSKVAFRFLADGDNESVAWTYAELQSKALGVAGRLREHAPPGERALLVYPPGLDFIAAFLGCLYAGVVAVPLYDPHPKRPDERLLTVADDCAPSLLLSDSKTFARAGAALDRIPSLLRATRIATDGISSDRIPQAGRPGITDLAFLQYTSGSTRAPRGVRVTHGNLVANQKMIQTAMDLGLSTVVVSWLPAHHDMGLIGDTIQPIYCGATCVKIPPAAFLQRPRRWLSAVTKYGGTIIGGPNFAFDLCVSRIPPDERTDLRLDTLTVAYCGSEPVRADTLDTFAQAFADSGLSVQSLYPCYGLAEATLICSGGPAHSGVQTRGVSASALQQHIVREDDTDDALPVVSCGSPVPDTAIIIVDADRATLARPGLIGEIWIAGEHIADGYWNQPELTRATMGAHLADGSGPYLRTGDLGFLSDGTLYVTGRLKDLIIVRGRNHYPQDLEFTASNSHPALQRQAVACFSVMDGGDEQVIVVHEVPRSVPDDDLPKAKAAILRSLSVTHQVIPTDVVFVRWLGIPKTTSGKVRRAATRDLYMTNSLPRVDGSLPKQGAAETL